jgi:HrpA-like RNA helicase
MQSTLPRAGWRRYFDEFHERSLNSDLGLAFTRTVTVAV